jgi:murein DD-endopeptidase MepM/ murein hydrolase activator NlpD
MKPQRSPSPRARVALWTTILAALVGFLLVTEVAERRSREVTVAAALRFDPSLRLGAELEPADMAGIAIPEVERFRRGDTLQRLFERLGLERQEAWQAVQAAGRRLDLRRLRAGDRYAAYYGEGDDLVAFAWSVPGEGRLWLERATPGDGWQERWERVTRRVVRRVVEGEVDGSLEAAIREAGAPGPLAYAMADVLQWDLDFNRDLRTGDRFTVAYEEIRVDGRFHRIGEIDGLVYLNRDRVLEAYRFGDGEDVGHYDGEGRPLRKQFLRSPLEFSRVTSGFSHRRFHPVLKRYRPHYGVDYGAPVGTPVRVTANGVVASAGWSKGGGKTVRVRHANGYETYYLHLSRYASGIRGGVRVSQGEVIGFVGATGLATGPHLDYRVKQSGRWLNPLSLVDRNPPAEPIAVADLGEFQRHRDALRETLGVHDLELPQGTLIADVELEGTGGTGVGSAPGR